MYSLTVLRYNNEENKFEEVKKKMFFYNSFWFFFIVRLHMILVYNGQHHVNLLMMIHL